MSARGFKRVHLEGIPVAEKTDLFRELYIETIIRNPKKVGRSFRLQVGFRVLSKASSRVYLGVIFRSLLLLGPLRRRAISFIRKVTMVIYI